MTELTIPVAEIPDGGARLLAGTDSADPGTIVTRSGTRVAAFRNDCPHAHLPLDLIPGRVMARDGRHLLCANHGALFRTSDGMCVRGPCRGRRLTRVGVAVTNGLARITPGPRSPRGARRSS